MLDDAAPEQILPRVIGLRGADRLPVAPCLPRQIAADFKCGNRFAEQEALALLAPLLKKGYLLLTALDSFRGDRQPESETKPRQSADNDRALGLRPHCLDKATIDLDLVELEITQVIEA